MIATIEYTSENIGDLVANARALRAKLYAPAPRIVVTAPLPEAAPPPPPEARVVRPYRAASYSTLALRRLIRAYRGAAPLYSEVEVLKPKPSSLMVVRAIIDRVAEKAGLTRNDILSESRHDSIVRARHLAIWLAARETPLSLPRLGQLFGNRDHTTILHAIRRENERRGTNVRGSGTAWKGPQQ